MVEPFSKFGSDESSFYKIPISVSNLDVKKVLVYNGFAYSKNKETEA